MLLTSFLATALCAVPPAKSPAPGEYVLKGGGGTLTIAPGPQALTFKLSVVGANAHTCELEGLVTSDTGKVEDDACEVRLEVTGDGVEVAAKDAEACRTWCGARAWFEGRYLTPAPRCRAEAVTASRAAFKRQYAARAWGEAKAHLAPVLQACAPVLFHFELGWIRNDLAITLHHLGDDAQCRQVLEPLRELAETDDEELGSAEPTFEEEYRKLARATRTNLKLCAKKR